MNKFLLALVVFVLPLTSKAADASCDGSTLEMLECIHNKIEVQERGIAAKTAKILETLEDLKTSGDGVPEAYTKAQKNLKAANVRYDDAALLQCQVEGALETVTGSLGRLVIADCLLKQKTVRNGQLRPLVTSER